MKITNKKSNKLNIEKAIVSDDDLIGSLKEVFYSCWRDVAEEFKQHLNCDIDSFENRVIIRIHDGLDDGLPIVEKPWFSISLSELVDEVIDYEDESCNLEIIKHRELLAKDLEKQAKKLRKSTAKLRAVLAK